VLPQKALKNDSYDDENDDYIVRKGEVWKDRFTIQSLIGKGSFGQVVQAYDSVTENMVAIKILKNRKAFANQGLIEIRILKFLNEKNTTDQPIGTVLLFMRVVKIIQTFEHRNHLCIVYELLSFNLYEILRKGSFQGLPLGLIRKFSTQILECLDFLSRKDIQVIHCDLKPEK
jgi:dual specificity tyrosine-phosphorylation-regulated kinase 1